MRVDRYLRRVRMTALCALVATLSPVLHAEEKPAAATSAAAASHWFKDERGCKLWVMAAEGEPTAESVQWRGDCGATFGQGPGELHVEGKSITRGHFVDGRAHGPGTIEFANGDRFTGNLRRGVAEGVGRYEWSSGDRYEGGFLSGKPYGVGEYRFADGSVYAGDFASGLPWGRGRLTLATGLGYAGQFESGKPTAPGQVIGSRNNPPRELSDETTQFMLRYASPQTKPPEATRAGGNLRIACARLVAPVMPEVKWEWVGTAQFRMIATVRQGRVTDVESISLVAGVPPEVSRDFLASIERAMRAYQCTGDHVFEQEFKFAIEPAGGPANVSKR